MKAAPPLQTKALHAAGHKGYACSHGARHDVLGGAPGAAGEGLEHCTFASSLARRGKKSLVQEA